MSKTPDEIKKGLECCTSRDCGGSKCPYFNEKSCNAAKSADAIALIQHKEQENAQQAETIERLNDGCHKLIVKIQQLEAERDAAVADIKQMVLDPYEPCFCDYCKLTEEECARSNCKGRSAFVWRGVQKD